MLKIHLGCDQYFLRDRGWLDLDIAPKSSHVTRWDAREGLPYRDGSVDYIFSSHLLEHLSLAHGRKLLKDCYKVLKPGGKIRITTPDLCKLWDLHKEDRAKYIEFQYRAHPDIVGFPDSACGVINLFVRAWGHLFIYDAKTLQRISEEAGFSNTTFHAVSESEDPEFKNLEPIDRLPPGFFQLESMTLEAIKP